MYRTMAEFIILHRHPGGRAYKTALRAENIDYMVEFAEKTAIVLKAGAGTVEVEEGVGEILRLIDENREE